MLLQLIFCERFVTFQNSILAQKTDYQPNYMQFVTPILSRKK